MSKIDYLKEEMPFTQIANYVLNDQGLSFRAKGIYSYLFSKPDGWDFAVSRISNDTTEGRDAVGKAIKELEERGYLTRIRQKSGRVEYTIRHSQTLKKPLTEKAKVGKSQSGNISNISNKEDKVIKSIRNKELATTLQVVSLIDSFKVINPVYKSWFGNKTQRKACSDLLDLIDLDKLLKLVQSVLPVTNTRQYAPSITTPHQLLQKFAQLQSYLEKEKSNNKKNIIL